MNNSLNLRPLSNAGKWALLGLSLNGTAFSAESQNPEQYKEELLAIEKRLDAKLKLLDEKLNRLEVLENKSSVVTAEPAIAIPAPVETKSPVPTQTVETREVDKVPSKKQEGFPASASYGKNGFEVKTDDGKFALAIQNRIQVRYANPFDSDPRSISDLERDQSSFMIRRARTKLKGHAYWPWLKYYLQYDWSQPVFRRFKPDLGQIQLGKIMGRPRQGRL
jgi:phosphate-selective porin OprO and OprP